MVESIIILKDNNTGFVLYYPEKENIEYVLNIMNSTSAWFICTSSDLRILEKEFETTIDKPKMIYDKTDIEDFVDHYHIKEVPLMTIAND